MTVDPIPVAAVAPQACEPLQESTVGDQLRLQAETFAVRPALRWANGGDTDHLEALTYRELLLAAEAAAAGIAAHAAPRARIAVWAANAPQWVVVEYAAALLGAILTPLNTAWTDEEVRHALDLTSPSVMFAGNDNRGCSLRDRVIAVADAAGDCAVIDLNAVALRPEPVRFTAPAVAPADPFLVQFTSGTTGRAKGATLSHRATLNAGRIRATTFHADEHDVWLNPIPLHHMGGSVVIALGAMCSGGCYVVMARFDPEAQVALMRATGATRTGGVPTMFYDLLETTGIDEALATVKSVGLGGSSVPPSLVERIHGHGATVSVAYAQSECPMVTQSDPARDALHVATTVGVPVPHTELRILSPAGIVVARGEIGEVCVRSPLCMLGYWGQPDATDEVFDTDGFLHTGDLGSIDRDGVLRIHGRVREVIIRGGENIYPIEIEDRLVRHPAVDAVAVVGIPSKRWGEEIAAVVKLRKSQAVTVDELMRYAQQTLARFKIPRRWRFVESLPLTASGKVRKVELAALFAEAEEPHANHGTTDSPVADSCEEQRTRAE